MTDSYRHPPQPPFATGLKGRCPRCGEGPLFDGFLKTVPRCAVCGLDLGFADSADGPAFFIMSFVGLVVVVAAFIVEFTIQPPYWVHAVLWIPSILVLSLLFLRPAKGVMIALQYRHDAREGRLHGREG